MNPPAPALSPSLSPALPASGSLKVAGEDDVRFQRGPRSYRVRGLARCLSAESLKVTLRLSAGDHLHLDTLDLYQARARATFVKAAALELGVSENVITGDLSALVIALEPLQEQAIRGALQPDTSKDGPTLTDAEEAAGLTLLRDPYLAERIVADVEAIGVVGEGVNALVGYLAMVSRLLDKPLAILIQSTSAAGKSTLMDALLSLMPESQRVHYSAMTGQSLFYLGEGDLRHKILAIAEEEGVRQAAYALKLLQSQGELSIASTGKDPATGDGGVPRGRPGDVVPDHDGHRHRRRTVEPLSCADDQRNRRADGRHPAAAAAGAHTRRLAGEGAQRTRVAGAPRRTDAAAAAGGGEPVRRTTDVRQRPGAAAPRPREVPGADRRDRAAAPAPAHRAHGRGRRRGGGIHRSDAGRYRAGQPPGACRSRSQP
ncbi:hypothetical protein [Xanthomonas hyacinthi]|uniref:hypothetical protein n=1 Tax=Xanthomonas hyacinthi TaxID=56455 RepID=UPI001AD75BB1|nr:hypothetical protein [Xanthomonas hyacinthi]